MQPILWKRSLSVSLPPRSAGSKKRQRKDHNKAHKIETGCASAHPVQPVKKSLVHTASKAPSDEGAGAVGD